MITVIALTSLIALCAALFYLGREMGRKEGETDTVGKIAKEFPYRTVLYDESGGNRLHMIHNRPFADLNKDEFRALVIQLSENWRSPENVVKREFPNMKVTEERK